MDEVKVIRQEFGRDWAFYNADCVIGMAGLLENSIHFIPYSPPFAKLYIYSDSVADMGNSSDDAEFFEGYRFALRGMYRVAKPGAYHAIHCKDLMRYMSSHGYSGQDDFSGNIVRAAEAEGWVYQKRITIWKNPVIEMQRTKTYGLLHKSFATRAEVVRVGAPDYVLIFRKVDNPGVGMYCTPMPKLPPLVIRRIKHIWSNKGENGDKLHIGNEPLEFYTPERIDELSQELAPGRLSFIHCIDIPGFHNGEVVGCFDMGGEILRRFEAQGSWKFHTRVSLTDGSYLVGFRNWTDELLENYSELNGQVTHSLRAPKNNSVVEFTDNAGHLAQWGKVPYHPDYVGTEPPITWHDDSYYSILVWQKYASPVWNDLDGLPSKHANCWMNIDQTNVLNFKAAKDPEDEKHICPLQLDLTERLILEYSKPGDVILSPYGGIGSEGYVAVKLGRKAILMELKTGYWAQGVKYLKQVEQSERQMSLI